MNLHLIQGLRATKTKASELNLPELFPKGCSFCEPHSSSGVMGQTRPKPIESKLPSINVAFEGLELYIGHLLKDLLQVAE